MADINLAFTPLRSFNVEPCKDNKYGYVCAVCGECFNLHKTSYIQSKNPHSFVRGQYRELYTFEHYAFDDNLGYPYVN